MPLRWVGEMGLERFVACQGRKHQLLPSLPEGRAAFGAVRLHFGLPLDACGGSVMPVYWQ